MAQLDQPVVDNSQQVYIPRGFFVTTAVAFALLGASGSALSFDGSTYLYGLLERQALFTPHDRYVSVPMQCIVLLLCHLTSDLALLRAMYGLTYATIPLLALGMSWQLLKRRAPNVFIWPVFGIAFGSIWMQFHFTAESLMAVQLSWPLLIAMAVGTTSTEAVFIAVLVVAIFFSHPFSIPLFAMCALVAFLTGLLDTRRRRNRWTWASVLGLLTIANLAFFFYTMRGDRYDTSQLSLPALHHDYMSAAAGLPVVSLTFAYLAALLVLAIPQATGLLRPGLVYLMYGAELLCIGVAAIILLAWACSPNLWSYAINFKGIVLFSSMPFMLSAILELLAPRARRGATIMPNASLLFRHRQRVIAVCATSATLALIIQSVIWYQISDRLSSAISGSSYPCMSVAAIPWARHTFLDNEALPKESILMQSRTPHAVITKSSYCADASTVVGFASAPQPLDDKRGWFDLAPLRNRLTIEQAKPLSCWFILSSDWNPLDQEGSNWVQTLRRDANGHGRIRVFSPRSTGLTMSGSISTAGQVDTFDTVVNGTALATIASTAYGFQPFTEPNLVVHRGENQFELVSHNLVGRRLSDSPLDTVSVRNLVLTDGAGGSRCLFRP